MAEDLTKFGGAPLRPKVVLGVAAHPDDFEFGIAGTIAKWVKDGCEAYYLILTNGNKGSSDRNLLPEEVQKMRQQEQRIAAEILGLKNVFFCDYEDGLLEVTPQLKKDIVRIIRQVKPEVVITMDPTAFYSLRRGMINHSDHRAVGQATIDAVFPLARDCLSFPELIKNENLEPHMVSTLLLTNLENQNYFIDISEEFDIKLKALAAHKSQIPDFSAAQARITSSGSELGAKVGAKYAEGYIRIDLPEWDAFS